MKLQSFSECLERRGEEWLKEQINQCQQSNRKEYEQGQNDRAALWWYPTWELCLGQSWEESLEQWHERWAQCGGKLYEGRMIAAKWDGIWQRLSRTFYDGLGEAFPPYAKSSCAYWRELDQDESIVIGVITEAELQTRMKAFPPMEPPLGKDGKPLSMEFLKEVKRGLEEEIFRDGGPRPGASREERVANKRQRRQEMYEEARAEYAGRNIAAREDRVKQDAVFRLLEEVERSLREAPVVNDKKRWAWLVESITKLTTTTYFDRYPNWKARAWVACGEMHRMAASTADELASLKYALEFNPKLSVKRRIRALEQSLGTGNPAKD